MTKNEAFLHLGDALPADIARRRDMGDLEGAVRLIDQRLSGGKQPLLAPRLEAERVRLERLGHDYPFTRAEAIGQIRAEWPEFTEAQFDALVDGGRIDWRMLGGEMHIHERFLESLRIYPREAPGLRPEQADHTERDAMLARMEREGSLTARITLRASIRALVPVEGRAVQAWLPACPQQSGIQILDATPGGIPAPEDAPQRTIWWDTRGVSEFNVTYRYLHRAEYVDPLTLPLDPVQPTFDLEEQPPHILFTPYLRALAARLTAGLVSPAERARAIYDYVTGMVDYRYQPAYLQLDCIPDQCAKTSSPCAASRASPPGGRAACPSAPTGRAPTTGPCSTWPPTAGCGRTAPSAPPPGAAGRTPAAPTTSAAWIPGGWWPTPPSRPP